MRPIKFRAWNYEARKMTTPVSIPNYIPIDGDHLEYLQFTGLHDKNGKECWEGDLMLTDDMYHDYEDGVAINALPDGKIVEVVFRDGGFFAGDELLCEYATAWEIIGNIHENPELINA